MRKVLRLVAHEQKDGTWTLQVTEQSHRSKEFGVSGKEFEASNGVVLCSSSTPEFAFGLVKFQDPVPRKYLFVRGGFSDKDHNTLLVIEEHLKEIEEAVTEYNEYEFEEVDAIGS